MGTLEKRIACLEEENHKLQTAVPNQQAIDGNMIARYVYHALPQTNLLSPSFLKRSFAVWGHFFVSNLIIGIVVGIAYACLMMVLFGTVFSGLIQNSR